jgi:hypothetical protein
MPGIWRFRLFDHGWFMLPACNQPLESIEVPCKPETAYPMDSDAPGALHAQQLVSPVQLNPNPDPKRI